MKVKPDGRHQHEIGQQVFEREDVGADRLARWSTSWMPRTSPTFQSRFGLSGCVLWQATQAAPITTGATRRT